MRKNIAYSKTLIGIATSTILIFSCLNANAQSTGISMINRVLQSSHTPELSGYNLYRINELNEYALYCNVSFDEYGNITADNSPTNPKKYKHDSLYKMTLNYTSGGRLLFREISINLSTFENLIYRDRIDQFPDSP